MPGAPLSLLEREEISRLLTLNPKIIWAAIGRQVERHRQSPVRWWDFECDARCVSGGCRYQR